MHSIQPAVNVVTTAATWGAATYTANLIYDYLLPDNTPFIQQDENDNKMLEEPAKSPSIPNPPSASSSGSSVPPPAQSNKIDLTQYNLDISNYTRIDLKADRSFIRAFYYIRNKSDATNEQLKAFVETNLVAPIAALKKNDPKRVNSVMHFVVKRGKAPYEAFFSIKEADSKLKYGGFTVKHLLDVARFSDSFLSFLETNEGNLNKLREVIGIVLKKNSGFYTRNPAEQIELIKRYNQKLLPLFQVLLSKMANKNTLKENVQKSLQEECDNLNADKDSEYNQHNKRYNEFINSLKEPSSPEVGFSDRCGVGDALASFTNPVICVTYIQEGEKQYNFGCPDRFQLNTNNYIIYMRKNNHCELLIPKSLTPPNPVTPSAAKTVTPQVGKPGLQAAVKSKEEPCKKYEDEYFLKGGTRKRKRRKDIPKKSRRKGNRKRRV
jgi:hypothetical protein